MWNAEMTSGGFLNSPGNFGAQSQVSPKEKKEKISKSDNVVPCTVEHLHQTTTERIMVGSLAVNNVTLLGMVRSVNEQATRITFQLDDLTGPPIEIQLWHGDEVGDELRSKIVENTYVRVVGNLRHIKDTKVVLAYKVTPVTDLNELTTHILEVIHTGMAIALMDKQTSNSTIIGQNQLQQQQQPKTMGTTSAGGPMEIENVNMQGLDATQKKVFKVIFDVATAQGIHFDELCTNLPSLSRAEVRKAIDFLGGEGHIYSTLDEDHFRATDSL